MPPLQSTKKIKQTNRLDCQKKKIDLILIKREENFIELIVYKKS